MKKTKQIILLLTFICYLSTIFGQTENNVEDIYTGYINICFDANAISSTRGEFAISTSRDGLVETPFEWFNEIAREHQITELRQAYRVKNQDWHQNGRYPMNVFTINVRSFVLNDNNPNDNENRIYDLIQSLRSNSNILFAEREVINRTTYTPNDPMITDLWYLENVQAFDAWDIQPGGLEEIIIGISDSGVKWNHPDLRANMWINTAELPGITINWETGEIIGGDGIDNDGNGFVDDVMGWDFWTTASGGQSNNPFQSFNGNQHGTHVAGTAAAVGDNNIGITGLAYNVRIVATKHTPNNFETPTIYNAYSSIFYLADLGVHIINCSWGAWGDEETANLAVSYAKEQGSLVIASAGNANWDSELGFYYPAAVKDVIGVIATDINDRRAGFSNYGTEYDISAPGVSILSTFYDENGDDSYGTYSGTSMASPLVAGVAALVLSQNPNMSVDELICFLLDGADPIDHLNPGYDGKMGAGRVNAFNSVNMVIQYDHDLAATIISGPNAIMQNTPTAHTITVRNLGLLPASGYTVNLSHSVQSIVPVDNNMSFRTNDSTHLQNNTILATIPGIYLAPGESHTFTLNWTPTTTGPIQIYGQIIYNQDERLHNNQTNLHNVVIVPSGIDAIYVGDPNSDLYDSAFLNFSATKNISQTIYLENELETGTIYQMTVQFKSDGTIPNSNVIRLYMANTNQSSFENNNTWIPYSQFNLVYEGRLPVNFSGVYDIDIALDTPFEYKSHNLAVMVVKDHYWWYIGDNSFKTTMVEQQRTIYWNSWESESPQINPFPNALDTVDVITNARFYFQPEDYNVFYPPYNLTATLNLNLVNLSWNAPITGSIGTLQNYRIYRNGEIIYTTSTTSFSDATAGLDINLEYYVTAVYDNPTGESVASNTARTIRTFYPPRDLTGSTENNIVSLSWTEPLPGSVGTLLEYRIYREGVFLGQSSTLYFTDNNTVLGANREYYVTAVYQNLNGESIASNTVNLMVIPLEWRPSNYNQQAAGTETNPYLINSLENLRWMSVAPNDWWIDEETQIHFTQTTNIDATETINWDNGKGFKPIGNEIEGFFVGVYNGNGYTISNLFINQLNIVNIYGQIFSRVGLFCNLLDSEIKNLNLVNFTINLNQSSHLAPYESAGGIAAALNRTSIENCFVSGSVYFDDTITSFIGGIVGESHFSNILNCSSDVILSGGSVGGIVGSISNSVINSSSSSGNIYAISYGGGITGDARDNSFINNCISNMNVYSEQSAGGILGSLRNDSLVEDCTFKGNVQGLIRAGGIVGSMDQQAKVYSSVSIVEVSGNYAVGGIAGDAFQESIIFNCYSEGFINGNGLTGGIIGSAQDGSTISNSYSTSIINGDGSVGGISGNTDNNSQILNSYFSGEAYGLSAAGISSSLNYATISNSYSTGVINGTNRVSGIANSSMNSVILYSFWDKEKSGVLQMINYDIGSTITNTYGLPTSEMQQASTYIENGWDFETIWAIDPDRNQGYPYLQSIPPPIMKAPQNLTAEVVEAGVLLIWEAPESVGVSPTVTLKNYHVNQQLSINKFDDINHSSERVTARVTPTSYRIYRNNVLLTETGFLTYTDSDVVLDNEYIYGVRAVYEFGESGAVFTSVLLPLYNPPRDLQAVSGISEVSLTWIEPIEQNFGEILEYKIYRNVETASLPFRNQSLQNRSADFQSTKSFTLISTTTYTFFADTGLTNGIEYEYYVIAVWSGAIDGESVPSNVVSAMPMDPVPNPAINPNPVDGAVDVLLTQVLSWDPETVFALTKSSSVENVLMRSETNAGLINASPTGYKIHFGTTNPPVYVETHDYDSPSWNPSTVGMPLLHNTTYYWQIIPFNSTGDAIDCPIWSFTTVSEAVFNINPVSHEFGNILIGNISESQTFTITNTGGSPLTISAIAVTGANASEFNISHPTLPLVINAGANAVVSASFSPTTDGDKSASIGFTHNASGSPHAVALTGIGLGLPIFSIDSETHNFGEVIIGNISDTQNFTITNTGGSPLTISAITVTGANASEFNINHPTLPLVINAGANAVVSASFSPTTAGNKSASIGFTHNASGSPHSVTLTGVGLGLPVFSIDSETHNFGEIIIGNTSDIQNFTITNTGGSSLTINAIEITGANISEFNINHPTLPLVINAGANAVLSASFAPTTADNKSASVGFTHNAENSPHSVTLSGVGLGLPVFSIDPLEHNFGNVVVGETSEPYTFTITNNGGSPLVVNTVVLEGANHNEFNLTVSGLPWNIEANETRTFTASFAPSAPDGIKTANLNITHNASDSPHITTTLIGDSVVSDSDIVAMATALHGNYPNPFNPETTIKFTMSSFGHARIDIYNIKGSLVRTLVNNEMNQGKHTVVWNGKDNNGQQVSSGIYFYQMKTSEYSSIKRMVLMK